MDALWAYKEALNALPLHLAEQCPIFETFLEGSSTFKQLSLTEWFYYRDEVYLSEQANRRVEMLLSPHSKTLLRVWAIQQFETS